MNVQTFLKHLQKSKLLSDAQLNSLQSQAAAKNLNSAQISDALIDQKHITAWQAKQLLKGETGFVLEHYQLLNPIGRGGMGHVFRGKDSRTGAIVAVKVMARKLTSNKTLVSRFRREIRASSKLNSPHIVRSLDAGRVGKVDFMVMEFVNGDQIDRVATVLQRVPTGLACEIVRQSAVGLQHAHEHGMVHRDVKPANLMLNWSQSGEGVVKLMDMGLVLLKDDDDNDKTVTRAGQVMGTPDFMSPEQGWDTATVDIRSDIYGLGCTLYRLLTGTVPFAGTNPLQVLSQRLQRDAPSVQTVCSDIPDNVAAIVSRMTLRDPTARYQQPSEVAVALEEVSQTLTRKAIKAAARTATNNPNANADFGKESDEEVDESDGTYRQFLREVQDGSAVNLMLSTGSSANPSAETMPVLNLDVATARPSRTASSRTSPRRGQKTGFLVMGVALVALIGLLIFAFRQGKQDSPVEVVKPESPGIVLPEVTLVESTAMRATTGERWTHKVNATFSEGSGSPGYRLSESAPFGMTVSTDGELAWDVPLDQTPAEYEIDLALIYEQSGITHQLQEVSLPVTVVPGFSSVALPEPPGLVMIPPDEEFRVSAAATSEFADLFDLEYQLVGKRPENLLLNANTGSITWNPTPEEVGSHQIRIVVFDKANPDEQTTCTYRVLVLPTKIEHVLSDIPVQKATAGTTFRLTLPRPQFMLKPRLAAALIVEPGPLAPSGLAVEGQSDEVVWDIPSEFSGRVDVPLLCRFVPTERGQPRQLKGTAILSIEVSAPAGRPSTMPPDEEIQAAVDSLQETLSRTISQARTTSSKAELARRLVEQSQFGEAGVSDAALLRLVEQELATKAKATDVLLLIADIRQRRYGIDQAELVGEAAASVRRSSLSPLQQDLAIEYSLRHAKELAASGNFDLTQQLLRTVESLIGRAATGRSKLLLNDVKEAEGYAGLLMTDANNAVAASELADVLDRWQFEKAFTESAAFNHVQLSEPGVVPPLADSGRSAWTVKSNGISFKAESAPCDVGALMSSQGSDQFVLRFEVLPDSNCAHLLFGVSGTTDAEFNAYRLSLSQSETGSIQRLRPRATLATVRKKPRLLDDQSNLVEIVVDGTQVIARINGTLISQADIPELQDGRIGFLADLRIPSPRINIRNVRILRLPELK